MKVMITGKLQEEGGTVTEGNKLTISRLLLQKRGIETKNGRKDKSWTHTKLKQNRRKAEWRFTRMSQKNGSQLGDLRNERRKLPLSTERH